MALRSRQEAQPETISEFKAAADEHYAASLVLWAEGSGQLGVYLAGYAAELLLKRAYFEFTGYGVSDPLNIKAAGGSAKALGVTISPEAYHSLRFWASLLSASRKQYGNPLPVTIESVFLHRTRRLYQNWWVSIRYRQDRSDPVEVKKVFEDVAWLRAHYEELWK